MIIMFDDDFINTKYVITLQVYADVCACCLSLSEKLGSQDFFLGMKLVQVI